MDAVNSCPGPEAAGSEPVGDGHNIDDPLLECLRIVAKTLQQDCSNEYLLSGLPLANNRLTPALAVRAALTAVIRKRRIDELNNLLLPVILLLEDQKACVLAENASDHLTVVIPESGGGERSVASNEIEAIYSATLLFIEGSYRFDARTQDTVLPRVKHWFWDTIWLSWPVYSDVLLASFLINLFALASPPFIMNVYDRVVPNQAEETLWVLAT